MVRNLRRGVVAGAVALMVAASGVAVSGASVASKAFPKACALFSPDIATTALGGAVDPATQTQPNPHETICKYTRSDQMGFGDTQVGTWQVIQPLSGTKVAGLGTTAINDNGIGLAVKVGSNGFDVDLSLAVGDFSGAQADQLQAAELAAEIATAKTMLAKLGVKAPKPKH
ncbi:MAG TPA: hypothetical protein VGU73_00695 [Acidimicrobiia bacterium]|nr:hypothetical protein [Acidimicrobiia bacterium]